MTAVAFVHRALVLLTGLWALGVASSVRAQLVIDIVGVGAQQIPVIVTPFAGIEREAQLVSNVITANLNRSGMFRLLAPEGLARGVDAAPQWSLYGARAAEAVVLGSVQVASDGRFQVSFRLLDVARQQQSAGLAFTVPARDLRATAHYISDIIYERLTGDKGIFSTRIAYVAKSGPRYQLIVADSDGMNAVAVLESNEPIISPAWSPRGTHLAYVSFENRKPSIYVQDLTTGQRRLLVNAPGNQSAPAFSPDGQRIVFASSQAGGTQLFVINVDGTGMRRLTTSGAIDTAPFWGPDNRIYFMSDRAGTPQIYRMSPEGGASERLTFEGSYNANPRVAPDGKSMVFVRRDGGRDVLAVLDFASRQVQNLSQGPSDESPSFAPNGRMIVYASVHAGRGVLAAVSADGRIKQRLATAGADVREPAWSPFLR
ncbi:MAG: Tol-Pal system beta propeller repeat protein TolB [Casimicrobiaceae bacterium]|nr:Tol-Pal system beta propeller repeat protein TolB [Casimicrobiaceae bacterium]MCX8099201.1 Tol-Pal system beta propeller repeat protein TolB [Casimicrobiaceae bacterium]MDW8311425.1 Tol-Pal system beta propeller repeat protein TolB [Burkholderiales bacterium]